MRVIGGTLLLHKINYNLLGGIAQLARAVALQAIGLGFKSPYLQEGTIDSIIDSMIDRMIFDIVNK